MSNVHLGDEILMAFSDGEVDETVAHEIEQALLRDPTVAIRVLAFMRSRRIVRTALAAEAQLSVPPDLLAAITANAAAVAGPNGNGTPTEVMRKRDIWKRPLTLALAASVAALAFGIVGYSLRQVEVSSPHSNLLAHVDDHRITSMLSSLSSGTEAAFPGGRIRPISTYQLASGSLCREFTLQTSSGKADAVACHNKSAWAVTFVLAEYGSDDAYYPADGDKLIASYFAATAAGSPLDPASERKALVSLD